MRADKKLGQHFLRDPEVLQDIDAVADVGRSAGVLEIGPGEGALTGFLVRSGRPVVALELDPRAVEAVGRRFGDAVRVVEGDAVDADLEALLPPADEEGRLPVVVGNLPYNAGSAILRRLLRLDGRVARMVVMLQREVAERVVAGPGSKRYGLLSVLAALQAKAWIVREVPPAAFRPRPKVHSAVLLVEPLDTPHLPPGEMEAFTTFVGGLFRSRRKTLANTLGHTEALEALGVDPRARPETLSPDQILALYGSIG
ncbi:MAG: 16S rRNA (adenine(1518)-N(6)/adenine(1519)-N(6))-dimethyltransferase RsmA [Myxococcota bacterium]